MQPDPVGVLLSVITGLVGLLVWIVRYQLVQMASSIDRLREGMEREGVKNRHRMANIDSLLGTMIAIATGRFPRPPHDDDNGPSQPPTRPQ